MGNISIRPGMIVVTISPDELLHTKLNGWRGEMLFGSVVSGIALDKIKEKRLDFKPESIQEMSTGFLSGNFVVTIKM